MAEISDLTHLKTNKVAVVVVDLEAEVVTEVDLEEASEEVEVTLVEEAEEVSEEEVALLTALDLQIKETLSPSRVPDRCYETSN